MFLMFFKQNEDDHDYTKSIVQKKEMIIMIIFLLDIKIKLFKLLKKSIECEDY